MKIKGHINTSLFVTGLILGLIAFFGFVLWLIQRVFDGKGTDLYQNTWGINLSAIGILILLVVVLVTVIIGAYYNHRHKQEEKDFLKKYGKS